jgi:hypothetical protein
MELLRNVLKAIKEHPDRINDIIDSFSDNQYNAKKTLIDMLKNNDIIDKTTDVVIMGSWYGSILVPLLHPIVNSIYLVDLDDDVIRIAKNIFFKDWTNMDYTTRDVFSKPLEADLFINTSCEHMPPLNTLPWKMSGYFAIQSNNMHGIDGHINCVNSMDEFKAQLPKNALIIDEDEIEDTRGIRFTLIGELC